MLCDSQVVVLIQRLIPKLRSGVSVQMLSFMTLHAELKQVPGMDKNRFSSSLLAMSMLRIGPTPKSKTLTLKVARVTES